MRVERPLERRGLEGRPLRVLVSVLATPTKRISTLTATIAASTAEDGGSATSATIAVFAVDAESEASDIQITLRRDASEI
jgi:hypothetical protein